MNTVLHATPPSIRVETLELRILEALTSVYPKPLNGAQVAKLCGHFKLKSKVSIQHKKQNSGAAPGPPFCRLRQAGSMSWQLVAFVLGLSCIVDAFVHRCAHVFVCSSATAVHTFVLVEICHPDTFQHALCRVNLREL